MKKLFQLVGLVTCVILFAYACNWTYQNFTNVVEKMLMGIGVIALIALIVRVIYGKMWLLNLGKEFFVGNDLIDATENYLNDLPNPKNESTANLVGHLVYRFTRLGVIGLVLAIIPTWLLFNQNELIGVQTEVMNNQTKLLKKQTKRLDQQTYLQEAERRGSLVFLLSNIMDKVDEELKEDYNNDLLRNLSPQLIGRIAGLSQSLKPYKYLEGDTLTELMLSPERGQLLISLYGSNLDSNTYFRINDAIDFSYAELRGANLEFANLRNIKLNNANLSGANLMYADLSSTGISEKGLRVSNLNNVDLSDANLCFANLSNSRLFDVDLRDTEIAGANLKKVKLNNVILSSMSKYQIINNRTLNFTKTYNLDSFDIGKNSFYKVGRKAVVR